jgi:hypothetical protein
LLAALQPAWLYLDSRVRRFGAAFILLVLRFGAGLVARAPRLLVVAEE